MPETLAALLLLTPLLAALACSLPVFEGEIEPLSMATGVLLIGFALLLAARTTTDTNHLGLHHLVLVDALGSTLVLIVAIAGATALLCSPAFVRFGMVHDHSGDRHPRSGRTAVGPPDWVAGTTRARRVAGAQAERPYYQSLHLLIGVLLLTVMAANLAVLWLGLALASVLAVRLAVLGTAAPINSTTRWALGVQTLGLAPAFLAMLLFALAGGSQLGHSPAALDWPSLHGVATGLDQRAVRPAFLLALLGFGAGAGIVVPQTWLPNAQRGTPAPAAVLTQVGLPACALYGLLRCQALASPGLGHMVAPHLLLAAGLLSLVPIAQSIGSERSLPRLLARAANAQMALVAAAFGLGYPQGGFAGMLLLVACALAASAALPAGATLCVVLHSKSVLRVSAGLRASPFLATLTIGGLLALGGLPPTGTFLGVVVALDAASRTLPVVGAALLLAWALVGAALAVRAGHLAFSATRASSAVSPSAGAGLWPLALPAAAVILLGVHVPDGLALLLRQAAAIAEGAG